MLFNSFEYTLFFPLVFVVYWFVAKTLRNQNIILLLASYFFYSCWDYRFVFLLAFSTLLDYYSGHFIYNSKTKTAKKAWLFISVCINLGLLCFFKYYNFFIESFSDLLSSAGFTPHITTLQIILPVGISFYTFHGLSYVFDIYNDKAKPCYNIVDYTLFVSFFPLLVAGPIERASHLLPQIQAPRFFDSKKAIDGLRQILWGLFKKIVIADGCAKYANLIFNNSDDYSGATLIIGAVCFAMQIYGDFSGYSDIALGSARLLGFELLKNFSYPYFSRDIAEFWRRWHISLSTWFRDYLYIPLGGSKGNVWTRIRNTFIIFLVSGFWHGANWTFIVWGGLNALYFLPLLIFNRNRHNVGIVAEGLLWPSMKDFLSILGTFILTTIAWVFFRAKSISHAVTYLYDMCMGLLSPIAYKESYLFLRGTIGFKLPLLIILFLIIEWLGRESDFALQKIDLKLSKGYRWAFYYTLVVLILLFQGSEQEFIYFQF